MEFNVIPHRHSLPSGAKDKVFLLTDGWDDWFKYSTMYVAFYIDEEGEKHQIGEVKVEGRDWLMNMGANNTLRPQTKAILDDPIVHADADEVVSLLRNRRTTTEGICPLLDAHVTRQTLVTLRFEQDRQLP